MRSLSLRTSESSDAFSTVIERSVVNAIAAAAGRVTVGCAGMGAGSGSGSGAGSGATGVVGAAVTVFVSLEHAPNASAAPMAPASASLSGISVPPQGIGDDI